MNDILRFFHNVFNNPASLLSPEAMINNGGLIVVFLILYLEIGVFFCFFFPGDSLVFAAGVLCATGALPASWLAINISMICAVIAGNMTAFIVGKKSGRYLMHRKETIFFKKEYMITADKFYKRYGGFAFVVSSFLPIIRTFIPIVAGILNISYGRFLFYSIVGAVAWIVPLSTIGYFLGTIPFVHENLGYILLGMVVAITAPVLIRIFRESKKDKKNKEILKELD